jgi:hypothetical protein
MMPSGAHAAGKREAGGGGGGNGRCGETQVRARTSEGGRTMWQGKGARVRRKWTQEQEGGKGGVGQRRARPAGEQGAGTTGARRGGGNLKAHVAAGRSSVRGQKRGMSATARAPHAFFGNKHTDSNVNVLQSETGASPMRVDGRME